MAAPGLKITRARSHPLTVCSRAGTRAKMSVIDYRRTFQHAASRLDELAMPASTTSGDYAQRLP